MAHDDNLPEAKTLALELFTRLAQHESLEEQLIHPLYPEILGEEGQRFLALATEQDIAAKKQV